MSSATDEPNDYLYKFLDASAPHNVILEVEGQKFYVESELLSTDSVFFNNLFEPVMTNTVEIKQEEEKKKKSLCKLFREFFKTEVKHEEVHEEKKPQTQTFELKDLLAAEFGVFLQLFYPVDFVVTADNYASLAAMSLHFGCSKGLRLCETFLLGHFDKFDTLYMIEFSVKYGMKDIKKLCSKVISENPEALSSPWDESEHKGTPGAHFKQTSFVSNNKNRILDASEKARAFIFAELIKAKF